MLFGVPCANKEEEVVAITVVAVVGEWGEVREIIVSGERMCVSCSGDRKGYCE